MKFVIKAGYIALVWIHGKNLVASKGQCYVDKLEQCCQLTFSRNNIQQQ